MPPDPGRSTPCSLSRTSTSKPATGQRRRSTWSVQKRNAAKSRPGARKWHRGLGWSIFETDRYEDAIQNFRRAFASKSHDLSLRANLGRALLSAKRLDAAEAEFDRVLRSAEGNIEARLGAAQVCVELGDDGDLDRYKRAEEHLTKAIEFGRNKECGSKRLRGSELAEVYYLRGYVRAKRYEKDSLIARLVTPVSPLHAALRDFRLCRREDSNHFKAAAAIENITAQFRR